MAEFEELGVAIKAFRVAANESLDDVSGAVEISSESLHKIEKGEEQPPLDILELIISHFSLREQEASRLWNLAGYSNDNIPSKSAPVNDTTIRGTKRQSGIGQSEDQALYTDMVHVVSNKYGLIINFIQGLNAEGQPNVVSKVGMSRAHAESIVEVLKKSLEKNTD